MEASWIKVECLYFVISFDSFLESLFEHVEFSLVFFKSRIGVVDKILCGRLKLVNVVNNFDGEGDFSLNFLIDGVMSFILISNVVTKLNLDHLMKINFSCSFFFFCSIRVEFVDRWRPSVTEVKIVSSSKINTIGIKEVCITNPDSLDQETLKLLTD